MATAVTIHDETLSGNRATTFTLDFLTARITVRELIRKRVCEEVAEYNRTTPEYFRGLVQPTDAERVLNGYRLRERRQINPDAQVSRALDAFERNDFFIVVDDRQVETLDTEITLSIGTEISFHKLIPLVGG
ncbi:MAG: hypothetical protein ACR2JW_17420 [Thermomicrobiales bacterium]